MPFTGDQLRAGFTRNAIGMQKDLDKALATGRKVRGLTADQIRSNLVRFRALSVADDATLDAHLSAMFGDVSKRLRELRATGGKRS